MEGVIPLVTAAQIAQIHAQMPAKTAFRILGGRSQKIPESTLIKHHWGTHGDLLRLSDRRTGHLADGFTVTDQFEICISQRHNTVASTKPTSSRKLAKEIVPSRADAASEWRRCEYWALDAVLERRRARTETSVHR